MKLSLFALLVVASASAVYAVEPETKKLVKTQAVAEDGEETSTNAATEETTKPTVL